MSLIVVNPTTTKRRKATKKGKTAMTKKKRSPKQIAAFKKMLAARKRHKNPSHPVRTRTRTRTVHHYAKRRNPSSGGGSLFSELMSKEGLMMTAAIVGTPTLTELAVGYVMPTASGTTRSLVKAGLGLGIAYAVHRFVSKKAGLIVGLVSVGSAVSDLINSYMGGPRSGLSASATVKGYLPGTRGPAMGGYSEPGIVRI